MTKRHVKALAEALLYTKRAHDPSSLDSQLALDFAAERIADALAQFNPRFDRGRFIKAATQEAK